ncbi:phosphate/phosphite/phosphonate ABC transporter substrate-binding protein [Anabaena sp. 4-3]|uniref:phosphate/phosphite/phosphonate ABC transporter substrate-binding protein n=1 Tax=Anabaena sp. 4-3 TaxID=1811979 RepID=UPI0008348634|nr:phosphate/phosphite/phosphonate ABC transporter substrate-binding protein [Anabaena sp. 4-3]
MKTAVSWLIGKRSLFQSQIFILVAIASHLLMGCTTHQPIVNPNPNPSPINGNRVSRRARERQGTIYKSYTVSASPLENLPQLTIGLQPIPSQTAPELIIKPLKDYLEKYLRRKVEIKIAQDEPEIIDWLMQNRIDMAYLEPFTYLEALEKQAQIQPLVTAIDKHTAQPWSRSGIVVKANSTINSLQDLKGKRVAFVKKPSTFGYLVPLAQLTKQGINPERDFAQVIYTENYSQSLAALEAGIVDAAATHISFYRQQQKTGKLTPQNFKIIWESTPITNFPIVASNKLPPELIHQLKQAFVSSLDTLENLGDRESSGYTLVVPADYTPIQKLRQELKLISPAQS